MTISANPTAFKLNLFVHIRPELEDITEEINYLKIPDFYSGFYLSMLQALVGSLN